ncbi:MAG: hypothetical protein HYZ36_02345, partial [Pedosphaera parvula]|nr:hypothetical protein [Pedosphaera parvula]
MKASHAVLLAAAILPGTAPLPAQDIPRTPAPADLWQLARREQATHRFSTLFTAHDVKNYLSTDAGLAQAIDWCR